MLLKEAFQSLAHELNFNEVNSFASSANCILPAHFIFVSTMSELDFFDGFWSFNPKYSLALAKCIFDKENQSFATSKLTLSKYALSRCKSDSLDRPESFQGN